MNFETIRVSALALGIAPALLAGAAWARPITYPGGWNVAAEHAGGVTRLEADRTLTTYMALGVVSQYDDIYDMTTGGAQATFGQRWNFADSQANVYAWLGGGGSHFGNNGADEDHPSGWAGGSADWESRWVLVQYQVNEMLTARRGLAGDAMSDLSQRLRVGIAPGYFQSGDVNTWFMLQLDQRAEDPKHPLRLSPVVRQFYGKNLWEYGIDVTGRDVFLGYARLF